MKKKSISFLIIEKKSLKNIETFSSNTIFSSAIYYMINDIYTVRWVPFHVR